eukprot:GHVT01045296.1.p1 GENE.GHVT01045296.1~~GHVT01045296.1.p1  ORF type:complete len:931 (+),score=217.33 GHVT01045296.1:277-3069(+)
MFILAPFSSSASTAPPEHVISFTVPLSEPVPPHYFLRVVSDRWLRCEVTLPISFRSLILPEKNIPHTELLDLQPLPVSALRFPEVESIYSNELSAFNPIQTQVFSTLYNTNENVLLCAPAASGKGICAEFAILRLLRQTMGSSSAARRTVYIAPHERTVAKRLKEWKKRFGVATADGGLGLEVNRLTGDLQLDVKLLDKSDIVVATPEHWDLLSRRWKTRKAVQTVRLLLVEDLHLVSSNEVGPHLEAAVSRTRFIAAQMETPIRIVAVASSVASAKDLAEWVGAGTNGLFNFHPSVRTVPLEISIHGFDMYHRDARLTTMTKPIFQALKHYVNPGRLQTETKDPRRAGLCLPALIFCSDRKQCRLLAVDLLLQAAADDTPRRFVHIDDEQMQELLKKVSFREQMLKETLAFGVGFLHEGLSNEETELVISMYKQGFIQVIALTAELTWGLEVLAHLVVVVDPKSFKDNQYVDYPMSDLLEMMGRASRPTIDRTGVFLLLCHSARRDYFRKFIFEPLPVESQLDQKLSDHINAEIILRTIENKQDAIDWLTWTYYYRRLTKNPNYYGLQGVSHQHLSDHLSELVESTIQVLQQAQCIDVEEEVDLKPLNLGLVAAFYYIRISTIELFNRSLTGTTMRKGMLEILAAASEFDSLPLRAGEGPALEALARVVGVRLADKESITDPHIKALILLQAHFQRSSISHDMASDQEIVLGHSVRLIHGLVDVISSNGWLGPALVAMELCQMVVQALLSSESPLKQLPFFSDELVAAAKERGVTDLFGFMDMEDEKREEMLKSLNAAQMAQVAEACNRYPVITVDYQLGEDAGNKYDPGQQVKLAVQLERDSAETSLGPICAPYFPMAKDEQWWLIVAEVRANAVAAIKRLTVTKQTSTIKLQFDAPEKAGKHSFALYLMSDCYLGCDQEYKFDITVR